MYPCKAARATWCREPEQIVLGILVSRPYPIVRLYREVFQFYCHFAQVISLLRFSILAQHCKLQLSPFQDVNCRNCLISLAKLYLNSPYHRFVSIIERKFP